MEHNRYTAHDLIVDGITVFSVAVIIVGVLFLLGCF
jgi:hypothetical protein